MLLRLLHIQRRFATPNLPQIARGFHQTSRRSMRIIPVPIRSDNYMYLLAEGTDGVPTSAQKAKAFLVDPADSKALHKIAALEGVGQIEIVGILTTHHHEDHAGGNEIIAKAIPSALIYGGQPKNGRPQVKAITNVVGDGDELTLGDSIKIKCLATPCHTQDSICYYVTDGNEKAVFTGDTLFQGGCGRFFEGTPAEMCSSLSYLAKLPNDTLVYNGHEYTADNLRFAKTVEPDNSALIQLQALIDSNEITTGKSTIGDEKEWNVFMRLDSSAIKKATGKSDPNEVMRILREKKNAM